MKKIIKKMQNRIMKHQQENGFETIFDFLNEDLQELEQQINDLSLGVVSNCTEIEDPYFDKKGKQIKEFALLKVYHFLGVNDQGRGRKHHYMYKWVKLKEFKGKMYWVALHLTKGDDGYYNLRAVADKQTRIIPDCEIIQSY